MEGTTDIGSANRATRKCLTHYRQTVARINRSIRTVQINQCANTWSNINFEKDVTSITLSRQRKAFYRSQETNCTRDRRECSNKYEAYIEKCVNGELDIKGARVGMDDFIRDAIALMNVSPHESNNNNTNNNNKHLIHKAALNLQWADGGKNMAALGNFIAMVDTSDSMNCDRKSPLYSAIGLGCRVAEHSKLGRRVMTFSAVPKWIDLSTSLNLTDMVSNIINNSSCDVNTNFVSALKMILDACVEKDLTPEVVSGLVLVVFSDMQIDRADSNLDSMKDVIDDMCRSGHEDISRTTIHCASYSILESPINEWIPERINRKEYEHAVGVQPIAAGHVLRQGAGYSGSMLALVDTYRAAHA
jgi:hypothetical protein